ncbi:helix-turn-helix transcriptional regulator [Daejeonella sp.]|uniref:helix-turn-helix domain-containing protein n=1 Tax=Daejeonella sp. TaxID=2805397 RepID=UPI0025C428F4|nr:helix-turn-helix transcriptional regulator [Daejeonella sp.]
MMEDILSKIREHRKKKGYSYETMASELNTSAAAYRKIEFNQTKLTVERLFQIAKILEAQLVDILDINPNNQLNQTNTENATGYQQQIENYFHENKEKSEKIESLYESRLRDKDLIISQLQRTIEMQANLLKRD